MIRCATVPFGTRAIRRATAASLVLIAVALSACTDANDDESASASATIAVTSTDDSCDLSVATAPAGSVAFEVTNAGSKETEFYLYEADGTKIVGEVEDIGPGLSRSMTVTVGAGTYVAACKPGMTGDGIRVNVTVTEG